MAYRNNKKDIVKDQIKYKLDKIRLATIATIMVTRATLLTQWLKFTLFFNIFSFKFTLTYYIFGSFKPPLPPIRSSK